MGAEFHNVWMGVDVSEESKKPLEYLTNDIKKLLDMHTLEFEVPTVHHMTFGYFKHITEHHLMHILSSVYTLKQDNRNLQLINPGSDYDETLHKIEHRKSTINDRIYFVLRPHNPNNIYQQFIQEQHISPHISLGSIPHEIPGIDKLLSKIKHSRDEYIKDCPITVDLSKIRITF